jgi:branched-chain amino acid transport system permease protein
MAEPLLLVRKARREFGGVRAVDGVSFDVPAGAIPGLIGPNGAGKSTMLKMIAGAIAPSSGSIVFDG